METTGLGLDQEVAEKGSAKATSPVFVVDVERVLGRAVKRRQISNRIVRQLNTKSLQYN